MSSPGTEIGGLGTRKFRAQCAREGQDEKHHHLSLRALPFLPVTALITVLTFVDRSNLGLAAPVLLHDVSLTRPQYGLAASAFFVSYGLCMAPSAFLFTRLGLRAWMTSIVILWGVVTAAMAAVRGFHSLVALRVLLGAAEAGTMPGCWFLLSRFVPADTLAYAYSWTLTFTVLAQVRREGRVVARFFSFKNTDSLSSFHTGHRRPDRRRLPRPDAGSGRPQWLGMDVYSGRLRYRADRPCFAFRHVRHRRRLPLALPG